MVKRLKLVPRSDKIEVISDNERYGRDELLREDVKIWGRVVGWFQWRG
jgi:phage repressor protein C with HTH and peptisase S24 domain